MLELNKKFYRDYLLFQLNSKRSNIYHQVRLLGNNCFSIYLIGELRKELDEMEKIILEIQASCGCPQSRCFQNCRFLTRCQNNSTKCR